MTNTSAKYRILIIGGYGFFGMRLARRLALDPLLHVILAGRDLKAATKLAATLNQESTSNRFSALRLDAQSPELASLIRSSEAHLVIHTSGPFQGQDYSVAQACIDAKVNYVDLADGRDFVPGITALDAQARTADVLVISGASSVPALSSAVVDAMSGQFESLRRIDIGISPGGRTKPGLATVRGILSYCGAPVTQWRDGKWTTVVGWQDMVSHEYSRPVGRRLLANCDVPDLQLLPHRYRGAPDVIFRAGVELPLLNYGLLFFSKLRQAGLVRNWARYALILKSLTDLFVRFGSVSGAMHVDVDGVGIDGKAKRRQWELTAFRDEGPFVPTLAAAALASKFARNEMTMRGATPCVGLLTLADFIHAKRGLAIVTQFKDC